MVRRFIRIFQRHTLREMPDLILKNLRHIWVSRNQMSLASASDFDSIYQVETANIREVGSLDVDSENVKYAVRYEPSPANMVRSILTKLNLDWSQYTFIDVGAGKGRVLLLAAEFPFRRIIGVEFSPELAKQANNNVAKSFSQFDSETRISCLCMDAVDFRFPQEDLICYFYNPFGYPVFERVLSNLLSSQIGRGRNTYVIYVHPVHRAIIERKNSALLPVIEDSDVVVYRVQS